MFFLFFFYPLDESVPQKINAVLKAKMGPNMVHARYLKKMSLVSVQLGRKGNEMGMVCVTFSNQCTSQAKSFGKNEKWKTNSCS